MSVKAFVHDASDAPTTLSEIRRVHDLVCSDEVFGIFAYATQSGVASFELGLGRNFWGGTSSRWLFGIDFGRTEPQALRSICLKKNANVRIVDGAWLVDQEGFIPRRDFHAKWTLLCNPSNGRFGAVIGSGNFSSNGLRRSIEAGATVFADNRETFEATLGQSVKVADELWENGTPAVDILGEYEARWRAEIMHTSNHAAGDRVDGDNASESFANADKFWIEVGYVTKNRGPRRPGNQIDFPRLTTARYFGFDPPGDMAANSVIGEITFETPSGGTSSNNLRLGANMMEKISLPIPETHGFDVYDGKVLVFRRLSGSFALRALELDDFERVYGDKLSNVRVMSSGRRYGIIV